MASTPSIDANSSGAATPTAQTSAATSLLVCLPPLAPEALESLLHTLSNEFATENLVVATAGPLPPSPPDNIRLVTLTNEQTHGEWVLAAGDYVAAAAAASACEAQTVLILSGEAAGLSAGVLHSMVDCIRSQQVDLVLPRFSLGVDGGLVNTALLYPLTRALFTADIRFPLPADVALSTRMLQRLAATQTSARAGQSSAFLWPVAEAAIAGYSVRQIEAGTSSPPRPQDDDFNALFQSVVGSLFADIEAKASFWQRARSRMAVAAETFPPASSAAPLTQDDSGIRTMIDGFHLAHDNLQPIWSLVLPPQSRLALKKLSLEPAENFVFDPALWARIVYDFTLAFHLRTLNRGHLLGAMTPLYLAWAASHLLVSQNDPTRASLHIDATAAGFELEKSYLVSRWRWPDRFNP